jgi:predicted negative regulator of RcsB-dependent stress response
MDHTYFGVRDDEESESHSIWKCTGKFLSLVIVLLFLIAHTSDVTDSIQAYNRRTGEYSYDVILENISSDSFQSPIIAVITHISSADVTVSRADGTDQLRESLF